MKMTNKANALRVFLATTPAVAERILRLGFWDMTSRHETARGHEYGGVWVSNQTPLAANDEPIALIEVELDTELEDLESFEWRPTGDGYRRWLIPAAYLNEHVKALFVAGESTVGTTKTMRRRSEP